MLRRGMLRTVSVVPAFKVVLRERQKCFCRVLFLICERSRTFCQHSICMKSSFSSGKVFASAITTDDVRVQKHISMLQRAYEEADDKLKSVALQPLISLNAQLNKYKQEEKELKGLIAEFEEQLKDEEFLSDAREELQICKEKIQECEMAIIELLIPKDATDEKDIVLELTAGVGGQEAMLFTKDMFDMYCSYAAFKGWCCEVIKYDSTELGGIRTAHIGISGTDVYRMLKFESGVHRVQRIPKTEKAGRIHTSTMTVAVLPQPGEIDIVLNAKDVKTEFKSSSGAGGQNVNKNRTCVRLTHVPTGTVVECQVERFQHMNYALAMKSLRAKIYQKELEKAVTETNLSRKIQIGNAARSDKVRTYNFVQDRITDHRMHENIYDVPAFFEGTEKLDKLLMSLKKWSDNQMLCDILQKYKD